MQLRGRNSVLTTDVALVQPTNLSQLFRLLIYSASFKNTLKRNQIPRKPGRHLSLEDKMTPEEILTLFRQHKAVESSRRRASIGTPTSTSTSTVSESCRKPRRRTSIDEAPAIRWVQGSSSSNTAPAVRTRPTPQVDRRMEKKVPRQSRRLSLGQSMTTSLLLDDQCESSGLPSAFQSISKTASTKISTTTAPDPSSLLRKNKQSDDLPLYNE